MSVIEIKGLCKNYKEVCAVDHLDLEVKKGELFAFLGINGAGKSTTIHILCGQLRKDAGTVLVDGLDIDRDVCPHSIISRSMIFNADSEIGITVRNANISLPIFSCDGEDGIPITDSTRLCITKSDKAAKIIRIKSDSFTEILTEKIIERNIY